MSKYHTTVLLQEAIDALQIQSGEKYIDATLGGGGHTEAILERGGIVLGIDQDKEALEYVKENFKFQISNGQLTIAQGNFKDLGRIAKENGFDVVAGILLDIGVSGHHLESGERGFSFLLPGPLDMRMDTNLSVKASDLVNGLTKGELVELFTKYGEEPFAKKIAEAIVVARLNKPFETTVELADAIAAHVPKISKVHPATRVFQALRIAVNDELHALEAVLPQAIELLEEKGRLAVITFHSLEDRIVKKTFEEFESQQKGKVMTKDVITASEEEIEANKKSRSAKLRIFEKYEN